LEVQMKDHKNTLQSRLDNLAKINEKTSSINEQMAILKAAEADLRKQREMIEGLITRVEQFESRAELEESDVPLGTPDEAVPVALLKTGAMKAFDASKPDSVATPVKPAATAKPKLEEAPLISDDILGSLVKRPEGAPPPAAPKPPPPAAAKPAFDPMATQKLPSGADQTQKMPQGADHTQRMPAGHDQTQKMPQGHDSTQRIPASSVESTQRIDKAPEQTQPIGNRPKPPELPREVRDDRTIQTRKLDPAFKPEATQKLDLNPPTTPLGGKDGELNPEATQRLDDSIWRLEEAKRILKGVKEKS